MPSAAVQTRSAQLRLELATPPALGDVDFVAAVSNADARRALADPRTWPNGALALHGAAGVGKTHLGRLWAERWGAVAAITGEPPPSGAPVWVDDADRRLAAGGPGAEAVFHLLNRAGRGEGALLLVGREPPLAWPSPLPDMRSRLNALFSVEVGEPDDALLRALLVKFFRERSVRPTPALLDALLARMERSALGAAAAVEALDLANREGARLNPSLARGLLAGEQEAGEEDARG